MSERSYWRERPAAYSVYTERVRGEDRKNMEILSNGLGFAALLFGIFGICIMNFELLLTGTVLAVIPKLWA